MHETIWSDEACNVLHHFGSLRGKKSVFDWPLPLYTCLGFNPNAHNRFRFL